MTSAIVRLLEQGLLRVSGNDRYAQDDRTDLQRFAGTTSRYASTITFQFIGKRARPHRVTVHDQVTAKVVGARW